MTLEVDGKRLAVSSLDRVLYPATGFTKRDLLEYYVSVAAVLVPHLAGRPLMLGRWPGGVDGRGWAQFECRGRPDWMQTYPMVLRGRTVAVCLVNDTASLLWAANQGVIEFHPYAGRSGAFDEPSGVILDLDPGDGVDLAAVADVALEVRARLVSIGLASVVKTSGQRGMHVFVPLAAGHSFAAARMFARTLAEELGKEHPSRIVLSPLRSERRGRVYIDWIQNNARRQHVAPYSLRAADEPWVSAPLTWDEVESAVRARDSRRLRFRAEDLLTRVRRLGDPFAEAPPQRLPISEAAPTERTPALRAPR